MGRRVAVTKSLSGEILGQGRSGGPLLPAIVPDDESSHERTGMHFVVSTGLEKPSPKLRRLIRSHVMLGKNRGKALPHRRKKPKETQDHSLSKASRLLPNASDPNEDRVSSSASTVSPDPLPILATAIPRKLA